MPTESEFSNILHSRSTEIIAGDRLAKKQAAQKNELMLRLEAMPENLKNNDEVGHANDSDTLVEAVQASSNNRNITRAVY